MGLDVYMYYCADRVTAKAAEQEHEAFTTKEWEKFGDLKYEQMSEEQKNECSAACKANALSLGLTGEYESHPSMVKMESDSAKYPTHMFKIGYFRSSYNDGGIERVMSNLGISGLYDIFDRNRGEEYEFVPDWEDVKDKAGKTVAALRAKMVDPISGYYPLFIGMNIVSDQSKGPKTPEEAVKIFEKSLPQLLERAAKSDDDWSGGDYSSGEGYFSVKGLHVAAALPGHGVFKEKGVYLMVKNDTQKDEHPLTWYLNALEIVLETVEYVLAQPDPQHFYIHWSA